MKLEKWLDKLYKKLTVVFHCSSHPKSDYLIMENRTHRSGRIRVISHFTCKLIGLVNQIELFNTNVPKCVISIYWVFQFIDFCCYLFSAIIENMAEFRPGLCTEAAQQGLMQWLLKRIKVITGCDNNLEHSAKISNY